MPTCSMTMSPPPSNAWQSPTKSPTSRLGRLAKMLMRLPISDPAYRLPDVVRGDAWPGGAGADRHAAFVCFARQFGHRSRRAMGRTGDHDAGAGLLRGGTGPRDPLRPSPSTEDAPLRPFPTFSHAPLVC